MAEITHALARRQASTQAPSLVESALLYLPSTTLAGICAAAYIVAGLGHCYHIWRGKDWWAWCLPVGTLAYAIGMFVRIDMVNNHADSQGWLIAQNIFIACAPAAFLAFNYVIFGRLVVQCIGPSHCAIRPNRVAVIFVTSDVLTILVQASGAAMLATADHAATGEHVFLTGLVLQALSYGGFVVLLVATHLSARKASTGREPWWPAVWLLYASSAPVMTRCIFRCIQVGAGRDNELSTNELYFYVLDALLLWLAIMVYVAFWPERWISRTEMPSVAHKPGERLILNEDTAA